jgi:hypothetical protein
MMKLKLLVYSVLAFGLMASGSILAGQVVSPSTDEQTRAELRRNTQDLLDAVAPGNVAVWDKLLAPDAIQVDENDVVRTKPQILADLKPLGPGLEGHLDLDDFRPVIHGDVAVVTHEDKEYLNYHGQVLHSRFRMTETWIRTTQGWRLLASQVLAVQQDPPAAHPNDAQLSRFAGRYSLTPQITVTIRSDGNKLIVQRPGQPDRAFVPETETAFFEPGRPRTRRIFQLAPDGAVTGFVDRREGIDVVWKKMSAMQQQ